MPKKPVDSSSDSSSSDSEVETKKVATKKVVAKKAPVSDSDSSSSSESEAPAPKKAAAKRAAPVKSDSDSSDSSDSEEEVKPAAKKAPVKAAAKSDSDSSSDSSDSSDSEDEAPVKKAAPKAAAVPESSSGDAPKADTIFVGGFPYDTTEEDVKAHFGEVGTIASLRMPTFPDTGRFRGVAFITYSSAEEATAALKFDQTNFGPRYLVVKLADGRPGKPEAGERQPREQRGPSEKPEGCKTVFVGGLSFTATEDDLRAAFDGCGTIVSARVAWDREQDRSKGFGYIDFEEETAVDEAIKLTGQDVAGRPIRVDYSAPRDRSAPRGGGFGGGRGGGRGGGFGGGRGGGFGGGRGGGRGGGFGGARRGGFNADSAPAGRKVSFN